MSKMDQSQNFTLENGTPPLFNKKPIHKKPGSQRKPANFFLNLRNEGLDLAIGFDVKIHTFVTK